MSRVIKRAQPPAAARRAWPELRIAPAPGPVQGPPEGAAARSDPVEEARRQGYEDGRRLGYEEGRRQGYEEGMARAAVALQEAEARMREVEEARAGLDRLLQEERARLLHEARRDIARLAMAAARRVLERELSLCTEDVVALVTRLLAEAEGQPGLVVRAHPDDAFALDAAREALEGAAGGPVEVVPDAGIARGGAVVESRGGTWDARLETRLGAVEAALREALEPAGGEAP